MNNQIFKWIGSLALLFGIAILFTQCETNKAEMAQLDELQTLATINGGVTDRGDNVATNLNDCLMNNFVFEDLSTTEENALLFMREEEKLARDVYLGLYEKWNARIFNNIAKAEQRHTDAIAYLLKKYGLTDPVVNDELGVFVDTSLQEAYNSLMAKGLLSFENALIVGATIEDLDINDLLLRMPDLDNADIKAVFGELTKGSRNHLRAFNNNLVKLGVDYEPQFISQELFKEIINTPREQGGAICGICLGSGNGAGNGTGICPNGNSGGSNGPGNGTGICPNGNSGGGNGPGNGTGICPYGNTGGGNGPGNGTGPHGNGGGNGNGGGK